MSASDKRSGQQAHAQIVQQFGGAVEGPLAAYVRTVGLKVALPAVPGSTPADWTITVLNSPVPNAMATPGGYLYITRGLMGMINSEAELASVLGHEAGHVSGNHSAKRQGRAIVGILGTILAGAALGDTGAQAANVASNAFVSGYSRSQEHDADMRGLRYSAAAGYDPRAAAAMLAALERVGTVEGKERLERSGVQSIFATHPVTAERVQRVAAEASRMPAGGATSREAYLSAIDGMAFGDAVSEGSISGTSFRHADLKLGFEAPAGFTLQNAPTQVAGQAPDGANFRFQMVNIQPGQSLEPVVQSVWQQVAQRQFPSIQYRETRINQLDAALSSAPIYSRQGRLDVGVNAYRFGDNKAAIFLTVAPAGTGQRFEPLLTSFRRLSPAEVADAARGRKVDVITVQSGDTAASLSARMAPPYNRVESFLALNGLPLRPLVPGERLKLIVAG